MAELSTKIKLYLNKEVEFGKDVILFDDGDGVLYIKEWNVADAQPTEEQLNALESQGNSLEASKTVLAKRKASYPNWHEFAEAYTEKEIGGSSGKWDAYVINYNKVRSDNPK